MAGAALARSLAKLHRGTNAIAGKIVQFPRQNRIALAHSFFTGWIGPVSSSFAEARLLRKRGAE
jgi:hypothetical protein